MNIHNSSLKLYLHSAMSLPPHDPSASDLEYSHIILSSLRTMLGYPPMREVLAFSDDPKSGIVLGPGVDLPQTGFGFFGWIRLERPTEEEAKDAGRYADHSSIFRFGTAAGEEGSEVELFISDREIYYSVRPNYADQDNRCAWTDHVESLKR